MLLIVTLNRLKFSDGWYWDIETKGVCTLNKYSYFLLQWPNTWPGKLHLIIFLQASFITEKILLTIDGKQNKKLLI